MPSREVDAYLEVAEDGNWTAHLLDLPGCVAFGRDRAEALAALQRDLGDYLAWLNRYGEPRPEIEPPVTFAVAELVRNVSPARASGEKVACFGPDRVPLSESDIAQQLRLMRYARTDLDALLDALSPGSLDVVVPGGERTVRDIARHIGSAECWYLTRLELDDDPVISSLYDALHVDLRSGLAAIQVEAERRISSWSAAERGAIVTPNHLTPYGDEVWTARKVLRRFIEHQREHLAELGQAR